MKQRFRLILMTCALTGCAAANSPYLGELVVGSVLYLGKTAAEHNPSGCPADCPTGKLCDKSTGYCERPPCGHRCLLNEQCVRDTRGERCEPVTPGLDAGTEPAAR
jgi:hypothetical protein